MFRMRRPPQERVKKRANLPPSLMMMMREFTVAVLREHPEDLKKFAMEFFNSRRDRTHECTPREIENPAVCGDMRSSTARASAAGVPRLSNLRASQQEREDDEVSEAHSFYEKTEEERRHITAMVKDVIVLQSLEPTMLNRVVDAMLEVRVKEGQCIIKQGDPGDNFYVIESGEFEVLIERDGVSRSVFQYKDKGFFGELALINNEPRSATINALTDGILYAMDSISFRVIVLRGSFRKRAIYQDLLNNIPVLQKLKDVGSNAFTDKLVTRQFRNGMRIVKEGEAPDGMYFIEDGHVRVTIIEDGKEVEVATLGKWEYFSEQELIENSPRKANIYAQMDAKVAFLDKKSFYLLDPCIADIKERMRDYHIR